jgi:hypothetical protein
MKNSLLNQSLFALSTPTDRNPFRIPLREPPKAMPSLRKRRGINFGVEACIKSTNCASRDFV